MPFCMIGTHTTYAHTTSTTTQSQPPRCGRAASRCSACCLASSPLTTASTGTQTATRHTWRWGAACVCFAVVHCCCWHAQGPKQRLSTFERRIWLLAAGQLWVPDTKACAWIAIRCSPHSLRRLARRLAPSTTSLHTRRAGGHGAAAADVVARQRARQQGHFPGGAERPVR